MITIRHTHNAYVEIIYYSHKDDGRGMYETTVGNMDDLAEHVCDVLVKHNFVGADVCSAETGEVLMTIERA